MQKRTESALFNAVIAMGKAGANADEKHPLRASWLECRQLLYDLGFVAVMTLGDVPYFTDRVPR